MHFPDIPQTGPYILTKTGPMFLADFADPQIRAAQKQAQLAGLQLAANPEQNQQNQDGEEEDEEGDEDTQQPPPKKGTKNAPPSVKQPKEERFVMAGDGREDDPVAQYEPSPQAKQDYKRWRGRALDDIKNGREIRGFTSSFIPVPEHARISEALAHCTTDEDVRSVFKRAQEGTLQHWQDGDPAIQKQLSVMADKGVTHLVWIGHPQACDSCTLNDGQKVKLGEPFASGAYTVPNHNHCICTVEEVTE